ncbi:hypothetical protein WJX73_003188 [Symbiochloris irregularis]|uniref:Peptide-N-glycosidase F N-terminal domain-containing protein n=1 Tax=Symbiochloris irregularis TaxID=706552 RepID=A0AAW1P9P1_9CHLO
MQALALALAVSTLIGRSDGTLSGGASPHGLAESWRPGPGDLIPFGFNISTIDNSSFVVPSPPDSPTSPVIVYVYNPDDAASRSMWRDKASIQSFLTTSPAETQYLFLSYGLYADKDSEMMRAVLQAATDNLPVSNRARAVSLSNMHFGDVPMTGISDKGANFLTSLMGQWTSARAIMQATSTGDWALESERIDASPDWLPWPLPTHPLPLQSIGDGCRDRIPYNLTGVAALVSWAPRRACTYAQILMRAQESDASAVVISAPEEEDVLQMICGGADCDIPLTVGATMIPHKVAVQLQDALALGLPVKVRFSEQETPGYYAAIDEENRLQQVGWVREASIMPLAWAAQWLHYAQQLKRRLQAPALIVPVFEQQVMQGYHGIRVNVTMPPADKLAAFTSLALDFELGCPGKLDADCPIWDHVVQLFVCCPGGPVPCDSCDDTIWLAQHHPEDAAERVWQQDYRQRSADASADSSNGLLPHCGRELGRWITPFRRRIGRWLSDATPLLPLLVGGQQCTFTAQTAPWALPWQPSLRLRFQGDSSTGLRPFALQPLFGGGTFDDSYNNASSHPPVHFETPKGTKQALLHAFITGHGSDDQNCAEFCPTSHHFSVNGREHLINFTNAGTAHGCADRVLEGVEPNEHGTWLYGRNGWCDGQDVQPFVVDITADLNSPGGPANKVEYKGLYQGRDPHPDPKSGLPPGYIMQSSSISFLSHADAGLQLSVL